MIVKKLLKDKVCFAVMQSYSYLTKAKFMTQMDYEIIGMKKDLKEYGGFFSNSNSDLPFRHRNPVGIVSRALTPQEIAEFTSLIKENFRTIDFGYSGKLYELIENPLNEKYNQDEI